MTLRNLLFCFFMVMISVSCIREEAPNAEADILSCTVDGDILKAEPEIDNESVTLTVKSDADITNLAPVFTLTPGATITPASGSAFDFTTPRTYTVTSEDGHWTKTYTVRCIVSGVSTEYHFEHITMEPLDFPTMQDDNGYVGKCAKLVTRSTGSFGSGFGMPIAAGNLFIGTFDLLNAIPDARKGTRLGRPFDHVPTYLSGYYKYKAGESYKVNGEEVKGKKDQCDIYAIFYETDENVKYLDGFNGLTSPNLISVARISDQKETDEWMRFYIPFVAKPGKVIDKDKLAKGGYQLSIVFSSSLKGDVFEGAEGSTLWIDEVEIIQSGEN